MGGVGDRLRRLEARAKPERRPGNPENRVRMRAVLEELANAKREGRPPSREAAEVAEAIESRRSRGA